MEAVAFGANGAGRAEPIPIFLQNSSSCDPAMKHRLFDKAGLMVLGCAFLSAPLARSETLIVNEGYRPIYLKFNGGNGVYGSEIGFNAILDTYATPNKFVKLGGTSQRGGANISVDSRGSIFFQMFDGGTVDEVQTTYAPQVSFLTSGKVGIGTTNPSEALDFGSMMKNLRFVYAHVGETGSSAGTVLGNNLRASTSVSSQLEVATHAVTAVHGIYMKHDSGWHFLSLPTNHGNPVGAPVNLAANTKVHLTTGGNLGIGINNPQNKLEVNGTIRAKEVIVESGWADHVFADGYALLPLAEVEEHIAANRRLPGVPSADEVAASGVSLGESQRMLLGKVEELTLYLIEMRKDQQAREAELRAEIATLREELDRQSL